MSTPGEENINAGAIPEAQLPFHIRAVSEAFFTNPLSYSPFHLTKDGRQIIACVEPRNEVRQPGHPLKTAVQTAGGGAGEGLDRAISQTALDGIFLPVEDGVSQERRVRGVTVLGGHEACKFITAIETVHEEMIEPGDFTLDDLARTWKLYGIAEDMEPVLPKTIEATKKQLEHIQQGDVPDLLELINSEYPEHANVTEVIGTNLASIYVTNHHPYLGLNRDRKARQSAGEAAVPIQGYHESRRAAVLDIYEHYRKAVERAYRMNALFLRSSATRTVLGRLRENTQFYDIKQGRHGLVIAEQEGL